VRANSDPNTVSITASCPFPCNKSRCPGRTDKAVSPSGAPKKIDGIVSMKVWVTAIDVIVTAKASEVVNFNSTGLRENMITEIRLMWIPGVNPVIIPNNNPITNAMMISMNIKKFLSPTLYNIL